MSRRVSVTMDEELAQILEKVARYHSTDLGSVVRGAVLSEIRRLHMKKVAFTEEEVRYLRGG